ncbi:MAG TPA: enoyl-CoA hydratase-related protein [Candidatus Binatia bacterium]|nr:enoyl-CoA hydratase-related protein [Candidatus Binatia bacterium]
MSSKVLVDTRDRVRWLTVNRAERRNALDRETMTLLKEAVVRSGHDSEIRVIVIGGAGGAFSAGADLKANAEVHGQEDLIETYYNPVIRAIRHAKKPVIAAVDGVAAGYGCSLALACDIRLASERARLSLIFVKVGLALDGGASYFLPRLVGLRAYELGLTGDMVEANEAERIGLVNRVYPVEGFAERVQTYAVRLAAQAPIAMAKIKESIDRALDAGLDEVLENERFQQQDIFRTEDFNEGVAAFLEKRSATYKGR